MKWRHVMLGAGVGIFMASAAGIGWYVAHQHASKLVAPVAQESVTLQKQATGTIEGKYLFSGTSTWARAIDRDSRGDYNWPFSQLGTFGAYDEWSTDFECPITNNTVPYSVQVTQLVFNCRPEFLPSATKYITLYDLANNHTDNQNGMVGLAETRKHLDAAGAQYYGSFDPSVPKDVCEVIALSVRVKKEGSAEEKAELPVAFCAWHYFYRKPLAGELDVMDRYAKIMPVFAFVEAGAEYYPKADNIQEELARQIIDHGPEFLVANSPHWVQNTEVYKNKLIMYSTGNFMFDQIDTETKRGVSLETNVTLQYDDMAAKWLKLGPMCKKFQDDCLEQAERQGLTKPKLTYKFNVVGSQGGAGIPTRKADAITQKAIEERTNWAETLRQLGQVN